MSFVLTTNEINLNIRISCGASCVSLALCIGVLSAAAWIYKDRRTKHHIDRVSFRLLLWLFAVQIVYDAAFICESAYSLRTVAPDKVCAAGIYWLFATLGTVNYLCTCVAINLMLTICYGLNPIALHLERWYAGGSMILGFFVPIIPAALGHFGADPLLQVCWIKTRDEATRIRYFVLDLYLWQCLACLVAIIAIVMTLVTLFRRRQATAQAMFGINLDLPSEFVSPASRKKSAAEMGQLEGRFIMIAVRISMYPIALILVNLIHYGRAEYVLYCIYYFFYGGRGIVFAALAIFIDPCIRKGLAGGRTLRGGSLPLPPTYDDPMSTKRTRPSAKQDFTEMLTTSTPVLHYELLSSLVEDPDTSSDIGLYVRPRLDSKVQLDMSQALSALPLEAHKVSIVPPCRPPLHSQYRPTWSRSFSGVPISALPVELQDDQVIDVRRQEALNGEAAGGRLGSSGNGSDWSITRATEEGRGEGGTGGPELDPLIPYIPDEKIERQRRLRAAILSREEAVRLFKETEAQL